MAKSRARRYVVFLVGFGLLANAPASAQTASPFGTTAYSEGALRGEIYALPDNTPSLPDLQRRPSLGTIYTYEIDVPARSFTVGFPGVTNRFEWFAIRYFGKFQVARQGTYQFRLISDDGARFLIDSNVVIDNDGLHPPREASGAVQLTAGDHFLELQYFQGPRDVIALQLFWTPPGRSEHLFRVGR